MSLSQRIAEQQKCAVVACDRHRGEDSLFCAEHLTAMWRNQLTRQTDGSFVPMRRWTPKDLTRSAA